MVIFLIEKKEQYISSLYINNIRNFKELTVEFNRRFNFITGPNASGKTSLLRCLSYCVTPNGLEDSRFFEDSRVWTDFTINNQDYRIGWNSGFVETTGYRKSHIRTWNEPAPVQGRTILSLTEFNKIPEFAPLFIGAFRSFKYIEVSGMAKEKNVDENRIKYRNQSYEFLRGTVTPNVKQWLVNRYFIVDKDWAVDERANWTWLLHHLPTISPEGVRLQFKEVGRDLEPLFYINDTLTYLEELSAGFQSILSIIFSIFDWIESVNESESRKVQTAVGTVIIDELDVHLHPQWQLTIRDALEALFPMLQFIITTHSPHLIASAKSGEIISLSDDPSSLANIKPLERTFSGWNTDQILEEIMGVTGLENKEYSSFIKQGLNLIHEKKIDELASFLIDFEKIVHPGDSILSTFKFKLAELELKRGE